MPIAQKLKPLYVAKNMEQLQEEGDKVGQALANSNSEQLIRSIDRMRSEGFKKLNDGDQEKAYIYFYRLTQTVLALRNKPDFKQHEERLNQMFLKTKLKTVMDKLHELSPTLIDRYDKAYPDFSEKALLEKLNAGKSKEIKPSNGESDKTVDKVPDSQSIKVEDLRHLIEQQSTRLLIIDCRALSSYDKSHVKYSNCISIPDSILEKGLSANKLTEKLQALTDGDDGQRQLSLWKTREKFDRIILYDWNSSFDSRDFDSPISVLYDALTKWDIGRKYQRLPEVVMGGFREITYKYPTLLTNPALGSYDDPRSSMDVAPLIPELSSISYPNFDIDDDLSNRTNKLAIGDSLQNIAKAPNSSATNILNNNLPAKANSSSSIVTPDRSTKPTRILPKNPVTEPPQNDQENQATNEPTEVQEINGGTNEDTVSKSVEGVPSQNHVSIPNRSAKPTRKLNSDHYVDNTSIQNGYTETEMEDFSKRSEIIREPSAARRAVRRPETPPNVTSPKDSPVSYGFQQIRDEREPSGLVNGDLGDKSMKSTMKRSKSIPNLKKTGDEDDLSRVPRIEQKPTYERNLKPSANRSSFEAYAGRRRDFEIVSSSIHCVTGLKNLGNTCYMNSVIQCLISTPQLVDYFLGTPTNAYLYRKDINYQSKTKGHTTEEFAALIREISNGHRSLAPKDFVAVTSQLIQKARYGEQQDSHEFLLAFINSLSEELNKIKISGQLKEQNNDNLSDQIAAVLAWENFKYLNDSIMIDLFWGQQRSTVTCLNCGKRSVTFDTFSILTLPIRGAKRCDIRACLDLYTTEEEVGEYDCAHCKRRARITKKMDLWKLPMYLIVQFQRFYNDGFWKKKVTDIDFPLEGFDLSPYVKSGGYHRYNLYGVSNHMGTMEGGHYTAYCQRRGNWYEFDDSVVRQLGRRQDIVTQNGYIVFYQRCS